MTAKEWFLSSKYLYDLDEHDESGYLGINEQKVAEMLEEYFKYKMKEYKNKIRNINGNSKIKTKGR